MLFDRICLDNGIRHILTAPYSPTTTGKDDKMDRRPQHARKPARSTKGSEVLRIVDKHGSISFAGTGYRVGNRYVGTTVEVRFVADTVQIALDGALLRTHRARHDRSKEFGALAQPKGKPRRVRL